MPIQAIRVVMIDDDTDDFEIVKGLLDRGSYNVYKPILVTTYDEGLRLLREEDGDVFLLDYNLGLKTGLDLLKEVEAKKLRKPVIMLTGTESAEIDLSALEAGATYFLQKTSLVTDHLLERTIRYAIKRSQEFEALRNLDKLKAERDALASARDVRNLFLANVSHELRTPLTAIIGYTDLALATSDENEKSKFLQVTKRNSQHLLNLVNDLLDIAKIEAGKYEAKIEPCNWRAIIKEVFETLDVSAKSRGDRLVFADITNVPDIINTDVHWFRQILINLLSNAIKFTTGGKIEVRVKHNTSFCLFVEDSGIGITEEDKPRLFQPFVRCENALQKKVAGTGLGLHLSKKIARSLGGDLELTRSQSGVGSTFCLNIPAVFS